MHDRNTFAFGNGRCSILSICDENLRSFSCNSCYIVVCDGVCDVPVHYSIELPLQIEVEFFKRPRMQKEPK